MLGIFITLLTFILILVTLFMMLVILMQRPNANAGMGAAFGGGVTDSTFGAETANVLTRATKWCAVAFFVLSLALYLLFIAANRETPEDPLTLPEIAPAESAAPTPEEDALPLPTIDEPVPSAEGTPSPAADEAAGPAASEEGGLPAAEEAGNEAGETPETPDATR